MVGDGWSIGGIFGSHDCDNAATGYQILPRHIFLVRNLHLFSHSRLHEQICLQEEDPNYRLANYECAQSFEKVSDETLFVILEVTLICLLSCHKISF